MLAWAAPKNGPQVLLLDDVIQKKSRYTFIAIYIYRPKAKHAMKGAVPYMIIRTVLRTSSFVILTAAYSIQP